jgi:hypothetical protein
VTITEFFFDLFNGFPNFFIEPLSVLFADKPCKIVMSEINLGGKQTGKFVGNLSNDKIFSIYGGHC